MSKVTKVALAFAASAFLSGCVETTASTPVQTTQPTSAPNIEPVSGISKDALVAIVGITDLGNEKLYGVFYLPAVADKAQLAAAPARICKSRGLTLISAEDKALEHETEMPGAKKLIVRCK